MLPKTEDGRPDLSRAPPQAQEETRRGIALVVRENGEVKIYLHHNILQIPSKHLKVIFRSHELYHLLYPHLNEEEVQIKTLEYLIQTKTLEGEIEFLENNNLDLRPRREWFKILTTPEHPLHLTARYNTLESQFTDDGLNLGDFYSNSDYFDSSKQPFKDQASGILSLPLDKYEGGNQLLNNLAYIKTQLEQVVSSGKIVWTDREKLHISLFVNKKSYHDNLSERELSDEVLKYIRGVIRTTKPFRLTFDRLIVDRAGTILVLGYTDNEELTKLRNNFATLFPALNNSHNSVRQNIIHISLGRIIKSISDEEIDNLKRFVCGYKGREIGSVLVNGARYIKSQGPITQFSIEEILRQSFSKKTIPISQTPTHNGIVRWLEEVSKDFSKPKRLVVFDYHLDCDYDSLPCARWIRDLRAKDLPISTIYVVRPSWDIIGLSLDMYLLTENLDVVPLRSVKRLPIENEDVVVSFEADYICDGARGEKVTEEIIQREVSEIIKVFKEKKITISALHLTPFGKRASKLERRVISEVEARFPVLYENIENEVNNKIGVSSSSLSLPSLNFGFYVFEIPESQVGGIADVAEGLPQAVIRAETIDGLSHRIFRATPYYQKMTSMCQRINLGDLEKIITVFIPYREEVLKVEVYKRVIENNFIDYLFKSDLFTLPYEKHDAKNPDEALKEIVAYNVTVAILILSGETNPDVVFLADWQLGLLLAYLVEVVNQEESILRKVIVEKEGRAYQGKQFVENFVQKRWLEKVASICWINNEAYRGQFQIKDQKDFVKKTGLVSQEAFERARWITPENPSEVFMILLKLGAETTGVLGGRLITVSEAYANEIMGENLHPGEHPGMLYGIFRRLKVIGILNGVMHQWQYVKSLKEKKRAKLALQKQLNMEEGDDKRIIFMISRLVTQKGISLIVEAKEEIKELLREFSNIQLFIGGPVEDVWKEKLLELKEELEKEFPKRVRFEFGFIQAQPFFEAGDLFLFPSLYEPCGTLGKNALNMVITLARLTGGLLESAIPIENDKGNAIVFESYSKEAFIFALREACSLMQDKERWERIQQSAPSTVKRWDDQFLRYQEIIKEIRRTKNVEEKSSSSISTEKVISDIQCALEDTREKLNLTYRIKLILYGSYAEGRQREGSDLDIAVIYADIPIDGKYQKRERKIAIKDKLCETLINKGYIINLSQDYILIEDIDELIDARKIGELKSLKRVFLITEDKVEELNIDKIVAPIYIYEFFGAEKFKRFLEENKDNFTSFELTVVFRYLKLELATFNIHLPTTNNTLDNGGSFDNGEDSFETLRRDSSSLKKINALNDIKVLLKDKPSLATETNLQLVLKMLQDKDSIVRFSALEAIPSFIQANKVFATETNLKLILKMLKDKDSSVCSSALEAIPSFIQTNKTFATETNLKLVLKMLQDKDSSVR
ncbi:MAG: glycogen/starch synthase, partial [Candidatus Omnitrophica bacterium]|nr:glycogen/starch synthase [Candidatus Omnitrophota bacterium]